MWLSSSLVHVNLIPKKWETSPIKSTDVRDFNFCSKTRSVSGFSLKYMNSSTYNPRYSVFLPSGEPQNRHGLFFVGVRPHVRIVIKNIYTYYGMYVRTKARRPK